SSASSCATRRRPAISTVRRCGCRWTRIEEGRDASTRPRPPQGSTRALLGSGSAPRAHAGRRGGGGRADAFDQVPALSQERHPAPSPSAQDNAADKAAVKENCVAIIAAPPTGAPVTPALVGADEPWTFVARSRSASGRAAVHSTAGLDRAGRRPYRERLSGGGPTAALNRAFFYRRTHGRG